MSRGLEEKRAAEEKPIRQLWIPGYFVTKTTRILFFLCASFFLQTSRHVARASGLQCRLCFNGLVKLSAWQFAWSGWEPIARPTRACVSARCAVRRAA